MAELTLSIQNAEGTTLAVSKDTHTVTLVYNSCYQMGDSIVFHTSETNRHYMIQLEDTMEPAFVYMAKNEYTLRIPFEEQKTSYNPRSFIGKGHYLSARAASLEEIAAYKNLAKNVYDTHGNESCYPHAFANVETRGEAVFAARNAIDGLLANFSHGTYPFASWGINQNPDAEWTLEFGRSVQIDKIVIFLRADFPHDNWWKEITVSYSDGTTMIFNMEKTHKGQSFSFPKKEITWLRLSHLIKADEPSPFPALSQLEVYGNEA